MKLKRPEIDETGVREAKSTFTKTQTHLIVFTVDQGEFKAVLCRVDGEDARPALPVQTVNTVSSHTGHIDGQVQGPDDTVIATGEQRTYVRC